MVDSHGKVPDVAELAVLVDLPEGARRVMVRIPFHDGGFTPDEVVVDFKDAPGDGVSVWTPSTLFPGSVRMVIQ